MYNINLILIFLLILPSEIVTANQTTTLAPESGLIQNVFKSDAQMAELLWNLFEWARNWKTKRAIGAINLRKWITAKRIQPDQIKDTLIVNTTNSTLIIYPADMNELGPRLPKSNYRVYRIPRSIDIKSQHELEVIFRQADSIVVAEGIVDELKKGEIKSKIALTPEIFFWVQKILIGQGIGDRYKLERRLLLTVLLQEYPDIDPGFKSQLEEFLPNCAFLGNFPMDLTNADRFILAQKLYLNPGLLTRIQELSKKARVIYEEIDRFSPKIEMNSCNNFYSTLRSLERIISEFDVDRDFNNPENTAVRLMRYLLNTRQQDTDLFQLLKELRSELQEYKEMDVEGLDEVLNELDSALKQSETLEDFRKTRLGDILLGLFRRIPKADIHHHLDGCISPELAFNILQRYPRLAELYGNPESPEDLKPYIEFNYKGEGDINWDDLWKKFELFTHILNTSLHEVAFLFRESSLEDFYNDGVTLIEHKISIITPGQDPGIDPASVLEAAVRGLIEAEEAAGGKLQTGLIPCIWKDPRFILGSRYAEVAEKAKSDPGIIIREARKEALRQVKIVVDLKKRWERERPEYAQYLIGIDTVGDEKDYIREITAPALQYAAENGLNITEHLGENWKKGELKQALLRIKQGIESGIIKRIGHATALGIETGDEEIRRMQEEIKGLIRGKGIHVETCPSSNKLLAPERSIPRYKGHPVVRFYRELGNVSINSDDSWILHTRGLSGEFMKVWLANPKLTIGDIRNIIENGFKASFIKAAPTPINPQELIKKGLDELLELVPRAPHEILAHRIFALLRYSFVVSKGSPTFEERLKGSILAGIARRYSDTLAKNGAAWLGTRGVVRDIVGITERLKGDLNEPEKEKLIDKLTEELKEVFYTPLDQYRYEEHDPNLQIDLRELGEAYPALKRKVAVLNNWLREQGEIMQVRLNLDHQGTYFDLANAIEQRILFGSDPHIMYDLHDDNADLGIRITEANWVTYAQNAGLFKWLKHVKPADPRMHGVTGVTSVSICFDCISYYGYLDLKKTIIKDEQGYKPTDAEIEDMVNQIIDGLIAGNLDIRLFSMSISPAYIWPEQAELIVDKLIEGIRRYVTQRKNSSWYQKRLAELIPSPLLENDPVVTEFIKEALSTKGTAEIEQLDSNELCHRLYYALEYPGIGLPDRPAPREDWWRHVAIHLKGAAIGVERYIERNMALRKAIEKHQFISNLLQEWLRRNQNNDLKDLPPVRPLSDTEQVEAGLELMRSS